MVISKDGDDRRSTRKRESKTRGVINTEIMRKILKRLLRQRKYVSLITSKKKNKNKFRNMEMVIIQPTVTKTSVSLSDRHHHHCRDHFH